MYQLCNPMKFYDMWKHKPKDELLQMLMKNKKKFFKPEEKLIFEKIISKIEKNDNTFINDIGHLNVLKNVCGLTVVNNFQQFKTPTAKIDDNLNPQSGLSLGPVLHPTSKQDIISEYKNVINNPNFNSKTHECLIVAIPKGEFREDLQLKKFVDLIIDCAKEENCLFLYYVLNSEQSDIVPYFDHIENFDFDKLVKSYSIQLVVRKN